MSEAANHVETARAVFDASADRYVEFIGTEISSATETPIDQSLLTAFAELVTEFSEAIDGGRALVADIGCGPGRAAALLARRGINVVGIDVSEAMLTRARSAHPNIEFCLGSLDNLPLDNGSAAGITCWYSIIYTPPGLLDQSFAEIKRVIVDDGYLLLAFQAGGVATHTPDAHATGLPLTNYQHNISDVTARLELAGFAIHATTLRAPILQHETSPQAFVIARKRALAL